MSDLGSLADVLTQLQVCLRRLMEADRLATVHQQLWDRSKEPAYRALLALLCCRTGTPLGTELLRHWLSQGDAVLRAGSILALAVDWTSIPDDTGRNRAFWLGLLQSEEFGSFALPWVQSGPEQHRGGGRMDVDPEGPEALFAASLHPMAPSWVGAVLASLVASENPKLARIFISTWTIDSKSAETTEVLFKVYSASWADYDLKQQIIRYYEECKSPSGLDQLLEIARNEENVAARSRAVLSLSGIADGSPPLTRQAARDLLVRYANDTAVDTPVRLASVQALCYINMPEALDEIIAAYGTFDTAMRNAVLGALFKGTVAGDTQRQILLARTLADSNLMIRRAAIERVRGVLDGTTARTLLHARLREEVDPELRALIAQKLSE